MSEQELKACPNPWCTSRSAPVPVAVVDGWRVACACGVRTHVSEGNHPSAAIAAWNRRASTTATGEVTDAMVEAGARTLLFKALGTHKSYHDQVWAKHPDADRFWEHDGVDYSERGRNHYRDIARIVLTAALAADHVPDAPQKVDPATVGDVSSLIVARCIAADGPLIDCPVCGAVDKERARLAAEGEKPAPAGEAWVLQRNDFPHRVFFDKAEAAEACASEREKDRQWREENKHVADVRVFWNVYPAALAEAGKPSAGWRPDRDKLALMIASWPAHYQDLGPYNEVIGDRVSHDRGQDIGEVPALLGRLADAILALLSAPPAPVEA